MNLLTLKLLKTELTILKTHELKDELEKNKTIQFKSYSNNTKF